MQTLVDGLYVGSCQLVVRRDTVLQQAAYGGQVSHNTMLDGWKVTRQARPTGVQEGNAAKSRRNTFLKYLRGVSSWFSEASQWNKKSVWDGADLEKGCPPAPRSLWRQRSAGASVPSSVLQETSVQGLFSFHYPHCWHKWCGVLSSECQSTAHHRPHLFTWSDQQQMTGLGLEMRITWSI